MDLSDAIWFDRLFRPYLGRFTAKATGSRASEWYCIDKRLDLRLLQRALNGESTVGWYASCRSPVFGIDIDDHATGGWNRSGSAPTARLRDLYTAALERLGWYPSVVFSSPHGLHAYYLLSYVVHIDNLRRLIKERIGSLAVEIKPTAHTTLRVPALCRVRDPSTLGTAWPDRDGGFDWGSLPHHEPSDLFGTDWRERLRRERNAAAPAGVTRKRATASSDARADLPSLKEVEETIMPFRNGETYRQTFLLGVACRREGIRLEKAIAIAYDWLNRSPEYTGELLRNERALEQRLEHIYERESAGTQVVAGPTELSPETKEAIERLAADHPFVTQRTKAVRRFLHSLADWKALHDSIVADRSATAQYDDAYPYYAVNRARGLYPLPSVLLERWNKNYPSVLEWLLSVGVLSDPSPYSPRQHVCRYYRISMGESGGAGSTANNEQEFSKSFHE